MYSLCVFGSWAAITGELPTLRCTPKAFYSLPLAMHRFWLAHSCGLEVGVCYVVGHSQGLGGDS